MKTIILGIDGLMPELFFGSESHEQVGALLANSAYGLLEEVIPLNNDIAWRILESGSDAGSLGLYGRRDFSDRNLRVKVLAENNPVESYLRSNRETECIETREVATSGLESAGKIVAAYEEAGAAIESALKVDAFDFIYLRDRNLAAFQLAHPGALAGDEGAEELAAVYAALDELLGRLHAALAEADQLLLVSTYSLQARTAALRLNHWLMKAGYLKLNSVPSVATDFDQLDVDWQRTRAFALGGREGRIYLNLAGRETQGLVPKSEASVLRDEIANALQHVADDSGSPIAIEVKKPEETFQGLEGVVPDLIVVVDGYACEIDERVTGDQPALLYEVEEELLAGQGGSFLLRAALSILEGEIPAARLEDLLPTVLHLRTEEIPSRMSGRSLLDGLSESGRDRSSDEEAAQRRLRGLGYL